MISSSPFGIFGLLGLVVHFHGCPHRGGVKFKRHGKTVTLMPYMGKYGSALAYDVSTDLRFFIERVSEETTPNKEIWQYTARKSTRIGEIRFMSNDKSLLQGFEKDRFTENTIPLLSASPEALIGGFGIINDDKGAGLAFFHRMPHVPDKKYADIDARLVNFIKAIDDIMESRKRSL